MSDFSELTRRAAEQQGEAENRERESAERAEEAAEAEFRELAGLLAKQFDACIAELRRLRVKPEKVDRASPNFRRWWRLAMTPTGFGNCVLLLDKRARFWAIPRENWATGVEIVNERRFLPHWSDAGRDPATWEVELAADPSVEGGLALVMTKSRGELPPPVSLREALAGAVAELAREQGRLG